MEPMDTTAASESQSSNVLYEPEIYRPEPEDNDRMEGDDHVSASTHAGVNASMISNYKTGLDPALF
jgi:hypothetical protein